MRRLGKRLISLFLAIIMILSVPITSFAEGMEENAGQGQGSQGTQTVYDGASYAKTGYLIYGSDSSGRVNTPVVFVSSYGTMPSAKSGSMYLENLVTRFGAPVNKKITKPVVWGFAPFSNSGNGMGKAIGNWLKSEYEDGRAGAEWILLNYMGMSEDEVDAYIAKENYISVEAVMWGGIFEGTSYLGVTYCSTAKGWAQLVNSRNYLGRYTNQTLPNSLVYEKEGWLGLAVPSDVTSRHESPEITAPVGYGIVSVRCKPGDKEIIKVYRTQGVVDQTTYGTCDKHVSIKDEGSYKVKRWHISKRKTTKKTPKRDYPSFESELPPTKSGGGPGDTDLTEEEQTIIILLEREKEEDPPRAGEKEDTLKAHELNYVFPNMASVGDAESSSRKDDGTKPTEYDISDDLEGYIAENLTTDLGVPVKYENVTPEEKFTVLEDRKGDLVGLGDFLYHRYNARYPVYLPWLKEKKFTVGTVVIPHYAYISVRTLWEPDLVFCSYKPENEVTRFWVTTILKYGEGVTGEQTRVPMAYNKWDTLSETKSDHYAFKAKIRIDYDKTTGHFETHTTTDEDGDEHEEEELVWDSTVHKFDEPEFDIMSYSITHYCDKYRTQTLPQATNENAGKKLETNYNCDPQSTTFTISAAYSTQLSQTLTVYPEVAYTSWINADLENYQEPVAQRSYMMGELARKCNPAILHAYKITFNSKGITTLPSALTGSIAEKVLSGGAGGSLNQGVLAMGETFEVAWRGNIVIDCYTAGLDINDTYEGAVRSEWRDDGIKEAIEASHEAFNANVAGRLDTQILMQYYNNSGNGGAVYDYYTLNAQTGQIREDPTDNHSMDFTFKDGAIQEEGAIIGELGSWGLTGIDGGALYELWGMGKEVEDMFFSNTDPDNASANRWVSETGLYNSSKWYDEESITLGVRFYHSRKTIVGMIAVDKTDYNLIDQIQGWQYSGTGTEKALQARFFIRGYLMDGNIRGLGDNTQLVLDGYTFDHVDEAVMFEIDNTRFLLANETTADWHK